MESVGSKDRVILIDKPSGMTSFGVVARVRKKLRDEFGCKVKVGHTGTLDPFATGLLILLSGKFTKRSGEFLKLDKVYEAVIKLGCISTTGDVEGKILPYVVSTTGDVKGKILPYSISTTGDVERGILAGVAGSGSAGMVDSVVAGVAGSGSAGMVDSVVGMTDSGPSLGVVKSVLNRFIGEIEQKPPKFSAIKVGGQRAYKLARKGVDFEVPSRKVTIYEIEILDYEYPILKIRCHVSSGTYIRTLAEDIGGVLGVGAYCLELRRLKIGECDVEDAEKLENML